MTPVSRHEFLNELALCADRVREIVCDDYYQERFVPDDLRDAVTLYTKSGGKRLRPAILLWSCGAVGGDPEIAWPAASAVELFHTWTLVHDDIIDRDELRRGGPTVHESFRRAAVARHPELPDLEQRHYGVSVAVLAGDVQHGWATSLLAELSKHNGIDPRVTLHLIERLDNEVLNLLVSGELLDIQFCHRPIAEVTLADIEDMLWKKTSVLYRFCAEAGAMIGLNRLAEDEPAVRALAEFSIRCGTAFQLQDDILGVTGDSSVTGKPVGNDIREGKRTTLVYWAYQDASPAERELMEATLGRLDADPAAIREAIEIIGRHGGVEQTRERARELVEQATTHLEALPDSRYRDLLAAWADFLISRDI
ncbi:MAG: Farnesyl diphosphate synthase [Calditrichaeota bacterium]|nr:Farnesyl diphosphate synthase [Calditrichota bacterium]